MHKIGGSISGVFGAKANVQREAKFPAASSSEILSASPSSKAKYSIHLDQTGIAGVCEWLSKAEANAVDNITRESVLTTDCKRLLEQIMRSNVDENQLSLILNTQDVHVVAGALKEHFKTLKEPVTTFELYNLLLRTAESCQNNDQLAKDLIPLFASIREPNLSEFKALLKFLNSITSVKREDLAYTWGPHLIRTNEQNLEKMVAEQKLVNRIILVAIDKYAVIFLGSSGITEKSTAFNPAQFRLPTVPQASNRTLGVQQAPATTLASKPPPPPPGPKPTLTGVTPKPPPPPPKSTGASNYSSQRTSGTRPPARPASRPPPPPSFYPSFHPIINVFC